MMQAGASKTTPAASSLSDSRKRPKRMRYERNTMMAMKHIATTAELRMSVYFPYSGAAV
jgi:hypothetical protein